MIQGASSGVHHRHTTDVDPGEEYVATVPRNRAALENPALLERFREHDAIGNASQETLWRTGLAALSLGGLGLLGMAASCWSSD